MRVPPILGTLGSACRTTLLDESQQFSPPLRRTLASVSGRKWTNQTDCCDSGLREKRLLMQKSQLAVPKRGNSSEPKRRINPLIQDGCVQGELSPLWLYTRPREPLHVNVAALANPKPFSVLFQWMALTFRRMIGRICRRPSSTKSAPIFTAEKIIQFTSFVKKLKISFVNTKKIISYTSKG